MSENNYVMSVAKHKRETAAAFAERVKAEVDRLTALGAYDLDVSKIDSGMTAIFWSVKSDFEGGHTYDPR